MYCPCWLKLLLSYCSCCCCYCRCCCCCCCCWYRRCRHSVVNVASLQQITTTMVVELPIDSCQIYFKIPVYCMAVFEGFSLLSVSLSHLIVGCLPFCLYVYLSVCRSVRLSVGRSVCLSVCLSVGLVCLSVLLSSVCYFLSLHLPQCVCDVPAPSLLLFSVSHPFNCISHFFC